MSAPARGGSWVLEVQGRRVELREGETTLGRSRGCGVVVRDPAVSRGHALLWVRGDRVTVRDLRSSNGTYLNGARLDGETAIAEGDRLTVGETQAYLRFARDGG
ncbi:MAG TPA: FHA domain-containing protein, partial [Thermoanaerobaculia bacterium]|nr:FHA domain-containing protein [Thermoanaerobaculia bacterium]